MKYQYSSPIGIIEAEINDGLVYSINLIDGTVVDSDEKIDSWFTTFFNGRDPSLFPYELADIGTEFEKRLRKELIKVQFFNLVSYGQLARMISDKMSNRAVGHGLNRNPFLIVVPCHRVIGADGRLTGFGVGLENKKILLETEGHSIVNDKVEDFR